MNQQSQIDSLAEDLEAMRNDIDDRIEELFEEERKERARVDDNIWNAFTAQRDAYDLDEHQERIGDLRGRMVECEQRMEEYERRSAQYLIDNVQERIEDEVQRRVAAVLEERLAAELDRRMEMFSIDVEQRMEEVKSIAHSGSPGPSCTVSYMGNSDTGERCRWKRTIGATAPFGNGPAGDSANAAPGQQPKEEEPRPQGS